MGTRWECPPVVGRFIHPAARPLLCRAEPEHGAVLNERREVAEAAALAHHPALLCSVQGARLICAPTRERVVREVGP